MADLNHEACSRRSVLGAALGAAAAYPQALLAEQPQTRPATQPENGVANRAGEIGKIRLSIIPACWPYRPAQEILQNAAGLGFESVQVMVGIDANWLKAHPPTGPETGRLLARRIDSSRQTGAQFHLDPDHPDEMMNAIKTLRNEHHVEIACFYTGFQAHWLDVLVPVAAAAQAVGCKTIKLDGSSASSERGKVFGHCASYREWLDISRGRLREGLAALRDYDVRLIFETHPWVITRSPQSCARLLDGFDPKKVGILFDVANLWFEGNEPIDLAVDLMRDYIAQLHVKNVAVEVKREAGHGGAVVKNVRLVDGVVDWPYVLRALKGVGFAGDAAIECFAAQILGKNDPQAVNELVASEKEIFCRWAEEAGMWRPR